MARFAFLTLALISAALLSSASPINNHPADRDDCDYTRAVDKCTHFATQSKCKLFKCIHERCRTTWTHETAVDVCLTHPDHAPMVSASSGASIKGNRNRDGDDTQVKERRSFHGGDKPVIRANMTAGEVAKLHAASSVPSVNSPCYAVTSKWSRAKIQHYLYKISMDVYADRANEHYTEGNQRWSGITGNVCPPSAPEYSDCSSTVTWIYWTLFGKGTDFLNGEQWQAGYTGTLIQHGTQVDVNSLQIGDLCFYYHPMHHVAIYVGNGKIVSHGMDPVGYYDLNYAPLDYCRRYI